MENLPGNKIKTLRTSKGYSQDHLAELAQISLRTVQRIENGETEARGDTLMRLAKVLDVMVEDLVATSESATNTAVSVNSNGNLMLMNLLGLGCIIYAIPFLGLLLPLCFWLVKKSELIAVASQAKKILNFQLTLALFQLLFLMFILAPFFGISILSHSISVDAFTLVYINLALPAINIIMIIFNAIRISLHKTVFYFPAIPFLSARRA